ncbi:MAG: methyl-accepting chemotaxis protein [Gammaproteobacteria bacterium]
MNFVTKFKQLSIIKQTSLLILVVTIFGSAFLTTFMTVYVSRVLMKDSEQLLSGEVAGVIRTLSFFHDTEINSLDKFEDVYKTLFPGQFRLDHFTKVSINNVDSNAILYDDITVNNNHEIADEFTKVTGALTTIFVRHEDDFLRVSTSVLTENGERATGTFLGTSHPGYQLLLQGKTYIGYVKLFSRDYITKYEPILSVNGDIIGLQFFGIDITSDIELLKNELSQIRIGDSGYLYILDDSASPDRGELLMHPTMSGQNQIKTPDATGEYPFEKLLEKEKGLLKYSWFVEGVDAKPMDKLVAFQKFEPWGWVIAGGANVKELTQVSTQLRNMFIFLSFFGCIAFAYLIFRLLGLKFSPVKELKNKLQIASSGDLMQQVVIPNQSKEVDDLDSKNEFISVAAYFNQMIFGFKELVTNLSQSTHNVIGSANSLNLVSRQNSEGTIKQQADADQLAGAIDKMAEMSKGVTENARSTAERSYEADQLAEEGMQVMDQTMTTINELANEIDRTSEVVSDVQTQSNSISEAVIVIQGIAEQTNLLALNAAIEAARAGEQGRGFAVVADEVRALATRSQQSTEDIQRIIKELQSGTSNAVETMEQGKSKSEECVSVAMKAKDALSSITETVSQISNMNKEIVLAAEQQFSMTGEVKGNIESISSVAAEAIETSQSINASAEELNKLSEQLLGDISRFKVREDGDDEVELF